MLRERSREGITYPFRLLIWEDAALASRRKVAINLERVPRATLVGIDPVLAWLRRERKKKQGERAREKERDRHTNSVRVGESMGVKGRESNNDKKNNEQQ